ncbi:MAG: twin-arginine translocase TatA/TatE family subunit [Candidatus Omnitrophica bacterium]|nr:twin-arginine translocase TatA/TatE family subunit [Candidatus Omnitrophota bacterium]
MRFGPLEIFLVILVIVLLFGGAKIKDLMRSTGEGIKEFKKAMKDDEGKSQEKQEKKG